MTPHIIRMIGRTWDIVRGRHPRGSDPLVVEPTPISVEVTKQAIERRCTEIKQLVGAVLDRVENGDIRRENGIGPRYDA